VCATRSHSVTCYCSTTCSIDARHAPRSMRLEVRNPSRCRCCGPANDWRSAVHRYTAV
jgi:hypothetical protein